jgi:hypothetical protein
MEGEGLGKLKHESESFRRLQNVLEHEITLVIEE